MNRDIKCSIFTGVMVVGLFLLSGTNLFAQQESGQRFVSLDEISGIDGSKKLNEQHIDSDSGEIETFSESIIGMHGVDYFYSGHEPCLDMEENEIDLESLEEGDQVTIDYNIINKHIVSVRLDEKRSSTEKESSRGNIKENKGKQQKIIRFENGVYTN
jgi:hypothetical protein